MSLPIMFFFCQKTTLEPEEAAGRHTHAASAGLKKTTVEVTRTQLQLLPEGTGWTTSGSTQVQGTWAEPDPRI